MLLLLTQASPKGVCNLPGAVATEKGMQCVAKAETIAQHTANVGVQSYHTIRVPVLQHRVSNIRRRCTVIFCKMM